jgi:hypothetical protein
MEVALVMTVTEQIAEIKVKYPEAWKYFQQQIELSREQGREEDIRNTLPKFDDDDEWIKEGK